MPTIEVSRKDLNELVGIKFNLEEAMPLLKAEATTDENPPKLEISGAQKTKGFLGDKDKLKIELKDINRPDLLCVEGIAKEIKIRAGIEKGNKEYKIEKKSNHILEVDPKVKIIRPIIACAIAKDMIITEEFLKQLIQAQEKLCDTFGRKRKEGSLGIYDYDKIIWPIKYTTKDPTTFSFKALGMDKEYPLKKILSMHEKGKEYGKLLENAKEYPIIIDGKNNVLSMPPIINSDYSGRVTTETKNLFIEVSGNNERFVYPILNTIVLALLERGAKLESVTIKQSEKEKKITPDIEPKLMKISPESVNSTIGLNLTNKQIIDLLEKAGYGIEESSRGKVNDISVLIPFYRQDILDVRDIIEDIAISYGYNDLEPEMPNIFTIGKVSKDSVVIEKLANLLAGLGAQEISNFILTNKEILFKKMNLKPQEVIELSNPMSIFYSCMRNSLLPGMLDFLAENKNARYPQELFEIGKIVNIDNQKIKESTNLSYVIASSDTNFTKIKQILDLLFNVLGYEYSLEQTKNGSFIDGRSAKIMLKKKDTKGIEKFEEIGIIGEISPNILENFNLGMPVTAFEIRIDWII